MSALPHWIVTKPEHCGGWHVVEHAATGKSIDESGDGGFEEATARFIADAFNVQVETGKSPRQLADEVERLTAKVESLTNEVEEESFIQARMAQLLAGAIVAIRGPEPELTRWGYHDLPERVRDVVTQRDAALGEVERMTRDRADMAIVPRKITPAIESAFLRWALMCCDDPAVFWEAMVNAALAEQQP
jgi:hypothetical protein